MDIQKLDKQLLYQPHNVKYCARCVISNQRFRIQIGKDGVCSACRFRMYEQTQVNWAEREKELQEMASSLRKRHGYHAVVAVSGGKDSGWIAHTLKNDLGLNVLCACFTPFMRTDIGQQNYTSFVNSGFKVLEGIPNGRFHRKLAKMCLITLGDAWAPFGMGQMAYPHWVALELGIPAVFYCENGEAQYSGDSAVFNLRGMPSSEWANRYHKGRTIDDLVAFGLEHGYLTKDDYQDSDLGWYRPPAAEALEKVGTEMLWLGYFRYHDPMEAFYAALQHTGFHPNPERSEGTYTRYASLDDKTDGFHFWFGYLKMGIGRCTSDAAHEIRDGQLTRDEGVALVRRYDGEFPVQYLNAFLRYLDITQSEFNEIADAWRPPHLWAKEGDQWKLRYQVT